MIWPFKSSPQKLANEYATDRARLFVALCYDPSGGGWYDTGKRKQSADGMRLLPVLRYRGMHRWHAYLKALSERAAS